jgi:hypothetical protein
MAMRAFTFTVIVLFCGSGWGQAQVKPAAKPPTPPPLVLYPACPCYHALGVGDGDTRIDARVNIPAALLTVQLLQTNGAVVQTASADASHGGVVEVRLRVPVQAATAFRCQVRLLDESGRELAKAHTDVHVAPRELSRVEMGPDGFLRVAGRPEFPIGLYSAIRYPDLARAGFTVTHNYEITTGAAEDLINANEARRKELLDQSWANGMRMMVELPRKAVEQAQWAQVRRCIETFRHHPGLLCWGSEERVARGAAPLANIAALYRLVHELDPDHPLVLGDTRDLSKNLQKDRRDFFPDACMDAGIWWWYPIPLATNTPLLEPPSWLTTTLSKKPLWIAIQAYQTPWKNSRYPTPAEYRSMAYLSIINGVKGLFFYTGSGEHDYQKKPAGLLNQPENSHWDYVQKLVKELRQFSPVIMAPAVADKPTLSPADAPVEFATRQLDGKLYLIAANKSDKPQSVRFSASWLKGRKVQVLYETHPASTEGESMSDQFAPLAVHVYQLE